MYLRTGLDHVEGEELMEEKDIHSDKAEVSTGQGSNAPGAQVTNIHVHAPSVKKNGLGTAGFVFALIGLVTSWVPVLGWIMWLLGAILSVAGIFRSPKGLAVAGTVISFIDVIILILAITACSTAVGAAGLVH